MGSCYSSKNKDGNEPYAMPGPSSNLKKPHRGLKPPSKIAMQRPTTPTVRRSPSPTPSDSANKIPRPKSGSPRGSVSSNSSSLNRSGSNQSLDAKNGNKSTTKQTQINKQAKRFGFNMNNIGSNRSSSENISATAAATTAAADENKNRQRESIKRSSTDKLNSGEIPSDNSKTSTTAQISTGSKLRPVSKRPVSGEYNNIVEVHKTLKADQCSTTTGARRYQNKIPSATKTTTTPPARSVQSTNGMNARATAASPRSKNSTPAKKTDTKDPSDTGYKTYADVRPTGRLPNARGAYQTYGYGSKPTGEKKSVGLKKPTNHFATSNNSPYPSPNTCRNRMYGLVHHHNHQTKKSVAETAATMGQAAVSTCEEAREENLIDSSTDSGSSSTVSVKLEEQNANYLSNYLSEAQATIAADANENNNNADISTDSAVFLEPQTNNGAEISSSLERKQSGGKKKRVSLCGSFGDTLNTDSIPGSPYFSAAPLASMDSIPLTSSTSICSLNSDDMMLDMELSTDDFNDTGKFSVASTPGDEKSVVKEFARAAARPRSKSVEKPRALVNPVVGRLRKQDAVKDNHGNNNGKDAYDAGLNNGADSSGDMRGTATKGLSLDLELPIAASYHGGESSPSVVAEQEDKISPLAEHSHATIEDRILIKHGRSATLDELSHLVQDTSPNKQNKVALRNRSVSTPLKAPRPRSAVFEDDENFTLDGHQYRQAMQDVTNVKTMLHKLKRILQDEDIRSPFETEQIHHKTSSIPCSGSFRGSKSSDVGMDTAGSLKRRSLTHEFGSMGSSINQDDIIQENDDLRQQVAQLKLQLDEREQTIKLLQQQMTKYSCGAEDRKHISTQTEDSRPGTNRRPNRNQPDRNFTPKTSVKDILDEVTRKCNENAANVRRKFTQVEDSFNHVSDNIRSASRHGSMTSLNSLTDNQLSMVNNNTDTQIKI
ncbi:uncharacterized protein LOC141903717 [Tubulanus polymorphus]|uniref:uncharacterized protein LOC141903717 n=1 Tax=Tubulanus polymorphus TaxID=672921 RepID=UPI003DA2B1A6